MKNSNLFHASSHKSVIHKIVFTGLFLGLVILFQYLERFMPLGFGFIKVNLTLLFILPIFYFAGPLYGILVLFVRYIVGVGMSGGFNQISMVSHLILLICSIVTIILMYIYSSLFNKIKSHNLKVVLILLSTLVTTSLILTGLNQIFFTPLYFAVLEKGGFKFSLNKSIQTYQYIKMVYFNIDNYWAGTFAAYFTGNIIKYSIVFIIYFPLSKVLRNHAKNYSEAWD
ncbi:MPN527 family putative ECF transporter permease subunit [Mycoplasma marinum]|uniref:ECF transporter S component n=1 Tax=Mycoplasma marinum TaxID=1937190 RepID=A0A4R0XQD1_9MOLU|nr:ECF transporter S component [Mycoplasma marinum]TCG11785.1 hypothetical protein C4B24_01380 [Mycoplasma marinum]